MRTFMVVVVVAAVAAAVAAAASLTPPAAQASDRPDEVGFVDPASGLWNLGGDESFYFGVPGDIPFLGDWDGDGIDTPGLYRPADGFAYITNRRQTGFADSSWFMGIPGDVPIAGDWDGDGDDTFSVYRPSEGKVYINNLTATSVAQLEYYFGVPSDKPFAIDFNGDGTDDVGLHRESSGLVYMTDAHTAGIFDGDVATTDLQFFWGIPDDAVFAGDWNATGIDSPGLVRPNLARTFLRFENVLGVADEDWPTQFDDWMPVVGRIPGAAYGFDIELSDAAVVPGPGQPGAGGAVGLNVTAGGEICFNFDLNNVINSTAAHIHEGPAGADGPIVVDLGVFASTGCVSAATPTAIAILDRPDEFYVQVDTGSHPAGAIRGQLAETRAWELSLVGAGVVGLGDADGFVTMMLEASTSGRVCVSSFSAQRIGAVTSIGLFTAPPGATGGLAADLTFGRDHLGCATVSPRSAASMIIATPAGHYLQVNTTQFPDGAVRAQLPAAS